MIVLNIIDLFIIYNYVTLIPIYQSAYYRQLWQDEIFTGAISDTWFVKFMNDKKCSYVGPNIIKIARVIYVP